MQLSVTNISARQYGIFTGSVVLEIPAGETRVAEFTDAQAKAVVAQTDIFSVTGFVYPTDVGSIGIPSLSAIGSSTLDQGIRNTVPPTASPTQAYYVDGVLTWARALSRQRFYFPVEYSFGVSGDTFAMMYARRAPWLATKTQFTAIIGGRNDIVANSFEVTRNDWLRLVDAAIDNGMAPIILPQHPMNDITDAEIISRWQRFTEFQQEHCRDNKILFADALRYIQDQSSQYGHARSGQLKADNIHLGNSGSFFEGREIARLIEPFLPGDQSGLLSASDVYHVTNNPLGCLNYASGVARGTMLGTGGTKTANAGLTYSGNLVDGWLFERLSSTSTCTVTLSQEAQDAAAGTPAKQVVQIAATSGGGATELYQIRTSNALLTTTLLANIAVGESWYAECDVEVTTAGVNMRALGLICTEQRSSGGNQIGCDSIDKDAAGLVLPALTYSVKLRTPPITKTAEANYMEAALRATFKTDAGAASVIFKVSNFAIRKAA